MSALRAAIAAVVLLSLSSCISSATWQRHTDSSAWFEGLSAQADDPWQWGPAATITALTPVAFATDRQIAQEAPEDALFGDNSTTSGDFLSALLGITPLALGAWSWHAGDDGRAMEVAGESLAATFVATQTLKIVTHRERPDQSNNDSFPSGHTSWAFAGATYIGRFVDQQWDSKLGYLAWLPASYVGLNRLEGNKHWASDVAFGALLGTVLTNWIWNAHYGANEHAIFAQHARTAWNMAPFTDGEAVGLSLTASF
jgi:membrane-associated phospholipid phosphatase